MSRSFWMTNRVVNPLLCPWLRSRFGRRMGRHLAVVQYRGRRTGEPHELVVQYARDADTVWIVPGDRERKTWWHNFTEPGAMTLCLAGENREALASVIDGSREPEHVETGLRSYLRAFPQARASLRIGSTDAPDDGIAEGAKRILMVQVDLRR
jgi:F420H(2)-dependent quinone reductase